MSITGDDSTVEVVIEHEDTIGTSEGRIYCGCPTGSRYSVCAHMRTVISTGCDRGHWLITPSSLDVLWIPMTDTFWMPVDIEQKSPDLIELAMGMITFRYPIGLLAVQDITVREIRDRVEDGAIQHMRESGLGEVMSCTAEGHSPAGSPFLQAMSDLLVFHEWIASTAMRYKLACDYLSLLKYSRCITCYLDDYEMSVEASTTGMSPMKYESLIDPF